MNPEEFRARLQTFLKRLSRRGYLAIYSASLLQERGADIITQDLSARLGEFEEEDGEGRSIVNNVAMKADEVRALLPSIPEFMIDLLIVDLEAFLHLFLSDIAGMDRSNDSESFETLLARVWPRAARLAASADPGRTGSDHWSYQDVILLSVVRNAIVHNGGELDLDRARNRLRGAGWDDAQLGDLTVLQRRRINDLFRFKRAVRTLANLVIRDFEAESQP